ncbi:MAG: hypothetical protein BRC25_03225 [Parcubacteria group bacterium SW_6_46_9]|nr:MAG: hypothetical protein BRC25_03225 [Parcubacteria group bacterium SW_6_46_9]
MLRKTARYALHKSGYIFWFAVGWFLVGVILFIMTSIELLMVAISGPALITGFIFGFTWCWTKMFEPPVGQPRPQPYRALLPELDKQE